MTWTPHRIKPGTVGPAIPGCEVALAEDGEIICRGGNVFVGYLNDPEKTAEALDDDGWLHTGDIGQVDEDGYFRVVDRKKELIITAGGKNISPANLEGALKTIPLVGQACAIGDNRPFVAALVVLDPDTAPSWAKQQGVEYTTVDRAGRASRSHQRDRGWACRGDGAVQQRRAGQEGEGAWRGMAPGLRGPDADIEAEATRHQGRVRRRDRGVLLVLTQVSRAGRPDRRRG